MKDLAGREATPVERRLLRLYDGVADLLREEGLAPCVAANLKEAAAALCVAILDLGLRHERPDDLGL
ncbi:MAG: hypothetical protein IT460_14915 [Planctomycetes bacterium]|nr:hypothetical protein [Planctomycetota bacterium]